LQFPPRLTSQSFLHIFEPFLCRTLLYENYDNYGEYIDSIWTLPFEASDRNYKHLPENECYCLEKDYNQCEADMENVKHCHRSGPFRSADLRLNLHASTPYFEFNRDLLKYITLTKPERVEQFEYFSKVFAEPVSGVRVYFRSL